MKPSQLSLHLRRIASAIDNSSRPSRALVAAEIQNVIRSLTSRRASEAEYNKTKAISDLEFKMGFLYDSEDEIRKMNKILDQFPDSIATPAAAENFERMSQSYRLDITAYCKEKLKEYANLWENFSNKFPEDELAAKYAERARNTAISLPYRLNNKLRAMLDKGKKLTNDQRVAIENTLTSLQDDVNLYKSGEDFTQKGRKFL